MKKMVILFLVVVVMSAGFLSGCMNNQNQEAENKTPVAFCSANPINGSAPLTVFFQGYGNDSDGVFTSYFWDFSDKNFSSEQNPVHTFYERGKTFLVVLTVTDNNGSSANASIVITTLSGSVPMAVASADLLSGVVPFTVHFNGTGTDSDGMIISYSWVFGDGNISSEQNSSHTFFSPGRYTVVLSVTDTDGLIGSDSLNITVLNRTRSPGGNDSGSNGSGGGTLYSDPYFGFTIYPPSGWTKYESVFGIVTFICPTEEYFQVNLGIIKEEGVNGSLDNIVSQWEDMYPSSVDNFTLISLNPTTVNGMNAVEIIYSQGRGIDVIQVKHLFVEKNAKIFSLIYTALSNTYDYYISSVNQSMDSFTIN